ncbi:helix-turn-helix transcriptional regulator [uncultured Prevotella sp.]|uniref:helix-turn-helix domain-containing protein n=1 Tax=uncultured Prevotella sp. TaxID=159272 RepID=UPI0025F9B877|nr:helix-turn-helix transcriptional regulator [uncultured Prevotella sp.]
MKVFDLKAFRKDKNITQAEIARMFSCNQNFISRIESGIRQIPMDKLEILQSEFGDISKYYKDSDPPKTNQQTKQVQVNEDSLDFITAGGEAFSSMIVRMMNEKQIAPYGLLADKDREIAELNRQIGKLEALLEVAKKGTAQQVGNAAVADVG